jgi:hypothetical protein
MSQGGASAEKDAFAAAAEAMRAGDAAGAFQRLRPLVSYPSLRDADAFEWVPRVSLFADVAQAIAGPSLGAQVKACIAGDDPQALYDAGFALIDQQLPAIAATFLARADAIAPDTEGIVTELCAALERAGLNREAVAVLRRSQRVLATSFVARYLLAFNALAAGDVEEAKRASAALGEPSNDTDRFLAAALASMLDRAARARNAGAPLDADDLRGWFFVMNQSVLLHVSPHGPEVMRGRYAFVQDSPAMCREGIAKIEALVESGVIAVPRVFAMPARGAAILAHAVAEVLGAPLAAWPSKEPGLVVAYDAAELDEEALRSAAERTPGQWMWIHASSWTEPFGYAPDFVSFLYQHAVAPWGPQLVIDPETRRPKQKEPDTRPAEVVARDIVTAALDENALDDAGVVTRLARLLPAGRGERRPRLRDDSPVKSARFT